MRDDRDLERRLREGRPGPPSDAFKASLRARMKAEMLARQGSDATAPTAWQVVFGSRMALVNAGLAAAVGGMLLLGSLSGGVVAPSASTRQAVADLGSFDTVAGAYPPGRLACRMAVTAEKPRLPLAIPAGGGPRATEHGNTTMKGRVGHVQGARLDHAESWIDAGAGADAAGAQHRVGHAGEVPAGGHA